ncbi:MAG: dihydrolipoyl dehydrogenase family protein [Marmoricola sp.]
MDCDVVVLGLGPGGEHVATELATAGLSVVGIDRRLVGGECPYYGCVPSKMMIHAAHLLAEGRRVSDSAGGAQVRPDWTPVAARIREQATDDWDDTVAVDRLQEAGVRFVRGEGRLDGPGRVVVGDVVYAARRGVVLNTGTEPGAPPIDGLADTPYWTNRDAVVLTEVPASLLVIGGGAIGAELTQVFARFGVAVTLVEAAPRLLAAEEPEASALVERALAADGVAVRTDAQIRSVGYAEGRFTADLGSEHVSADRLLVAAGRRPNLHGIGLETVGLDPDAPSVPTDERLRAADGVWAIGDITGRGAYTHMSMDEGDLVIADVLGQERAPAEDHAVPRVTFTDPEVGSVGMTEQQARDAGVAVRIGRADGGARGWITESPEMVKLVVDADRSVLVGATAVGPAGGEVLSMLTLAVHAEVPVSTLRTMHFAYPTYHRAVEAALADLGDDLG